jgi:calcineurin-like phosphoesterase family protein
MIWFTADWHLGDVRFSRDAPLLRPFKSLVDQHQTIIKNINDWVQPDDQLIHLGDVVVDADYLPLLEQINCKNKTLIRGNYDEGKEKELSKYFDGIEEELYYNLSNGDKIYLNHYPINAKTDCFNVVGHIHGLWKVQPNMINVGVDAWHFLPVSEEQLLYVMNAIRNHYDENVFPNSQFIQPT